MRRRVAIDGGDDVRPERLGNGRIVLERIRIGLADQLAGNVGPIEPLGDAVDHRGFERIVVENRGIDEGRKLRLGAGDGLRLVADAFPYRVDPIELEPCLMLRHDASGRLDLRVCSTGKGRHSPPPAPSPKAAFPGPQARGFDANVEVFPRTR